jgi:hypothetical protein
MENESLLDYGACSLSEVDWEAAVRSSETSINFETTRRYIQEGFHFQCLDVF